MSMTAPIYIAIPTTVTALRYMHGNDCYGLEETTEDVDGVTLYTLIVPHPDGDLVAREGDWVMQDVVSGIFHVSADNVFRFMFTQEGVEQP